MISPHPTRNSRCISKFIQPDKGNLYSQTPRNEIIESAFTNISRISSSPKSNPGNVLKERINVNEQDSYFPNKKIYKNKFSIPNKATKKKSMEHKQHKSMLEISSCEFFEDEKSESDYYNDIDNLIDSLKESKKIIEEKDKSINDFKKKYEDIIGKNKELLDEIDELKYLFQIIHDPNEDTKKEIQNYKEKIVSMKENIQKEKDENVSLKNQIFSFCEQIKKLEEKEKETQKLIDCTQKENMKLNSALKEKEDIIQTYNNEEKINLILLNDALNEKLNSLEKNDKEKNEKILNLQASITEANQQIQRFTEEKERANSEIQNLIRNNSEFNETNIQMKREIKSKEQLISGLESNNIKFQKTIIEQENSIKELNRSIEATKGMLEKMGEDRKVQVIISENSKIAELEDALQQKNNNLSAITLEYEQMKKDYDLKEKELAKSQKELMDQTSITVSFASRLTQKESELNETQQSQLLLTKQLEELKKKNQSLERLIKNKIEEINNIHRDKRKEFVTLQDRIKSLTEEKENINKLLNNSNYEIIDLKEKFENEKSLSQSYSDKNAELDKEISLLKEQLQNSEKESQLIDFRLKESNEKVSQLNSDIISLKDSINQYVNSESKMKNSIQQITNENITLTEEKNILNKKIAEKEKFVNDIKNDYEVLKSKYNNLYKDYQDYITDHKKEKEISDIDKNTISRQQKEIMSLSQQIELLESKTSELNEENKILLYKIDGLQNGDESINSSLIVTPKKPKKTDDSDKVIELQKKLKDQKLKMNEMNKIIMELTELAHVLENQLINGDSPEDYDKQKLYYENIQLRDKVESLQNEKDRFEKELVAAESKAKQIAQIMEMLKK